MSLTCKICGHEEITPNADGKVELVSHIEREHDLVAYLADFNIVDVGELVLEPKTKIVAKTKSGMVVVDVAGVSLPVNLKANPYVPKVNGSYIFGEHSKDIAQDILENKRVLLVGHTGCGKSSCVEQIAALTRNGLLRVNLNGQITIGDLVGFWTVKGGETVWVDGLLPTAMRNGYWVNLDELDFGEPAILSILNPVLEPGGKLTLKEKGHEVVEPHPNFRIFATGNSIGCMQDYRGMYQGTNIMNEAFLDRWRVYKVDYMDAKAEAKVLCGLMPKLNERIASRIVGVANLIRESFEKEDITCTFSTRRVIDWSEQMLRHQDPVKAAQSTIFAKISREDAEIIKNIITRAMYEGPTS